MELEFCFEHISMPTHAKISAFLSAASMYKEWQEVFQTTVLQIHLLYCVGSGYRYSYGFSSCDFKMNLLWKKSPHVYALIKSADNHFSDSDYDAETISQGWITPNDFWSNVWLRFPKFDSNIKESLCFSFRVSALLVLEKSSWPTGS